MCAKCPVDSGAMETVYGMGAKKIESYGARFTQVITAFLNEHGGETAITEALSGMTVDTTTAVPARKKKLPFYIVPEKLDEVELTDTCMLSELTNRINALCEEPDRKKLTAAFVNQLLVEKGYLEEVLQGEEKVKRVTEKGKAAGILEEERRAKYGKNYYAMIHTRESQRMILKKLQDYCILMAWEHGNLKTDTNTYYNITLFLSANAEKIYRKSRLRKRATADVKGI